MSEVPPTRMNQQVFKGKKKAAESGHKLLKKKADALKVGFLVHIFGEACQFPGLAIVGIRKISQFP